MGGIVDIYFQNISTKKDAPLMGGGFIFISKYFTVTIYFSKVRNVFHSRNILFKNLTDIFRSRIILWFCFGYVVYFESKVGKDLFSIWPSGFWRFRAERFSVVFSLSALPNATRVYVNCHQCHDDGNHWISKFLQHVSTISCCFSHFRYISEYSKHGGILRVD